MKKSNFIVVLIIVLAGIGTPLFSGIMMERIVKQSFNDINQMYAETGSDISLELLKYDRGFFVSQIEWRLNSGALKTFYGVDEILFIDTANHGYKGVTSTTSLSRNNWYINFVNEKLEGKNPVKIQTEYKLLGDIQSTVTLASFSLKQDNDVVEILPGKMSITLEKGLQNGVSKMVWEGCKIPGKFMVERFSIHSKLKKIRPAIFQGNVSFTVKNLKVAGNNKSFELSNIVCDSTMDYSNETESLSFGMAYGADRIKTDQNNINNASVRIELNRLDARGYEDFIQMYSRVMNKTMRNINVSQQDPEKMKKVVEEQMAAFGIKMAGAYEKFLKKGLEIQISDLRAQLPQGEIKGDVSLSLKKDMTLAQFIPILMQPSAVLDIFFLKSDVSFPYQLVGDNPVLFSPVYKGMQTGLLLKDGDRVIHKAETRDGKLFLNHKEVMLN